MNLPEALADLAGPAIALFSGGILGTLFFGGLWWTVRHAATFRRPGLSVFISLMLRIGGTLIGFYLAAGGRWQRLLLCLLGFVAARLAVSWLTSAPADPSPQARRKPPALTLCEVRRDAQP